MYFQPGDVFGYFTPSYKLNTNTYPLNVTFRNASMDDANASLVVDMYSVPSKSCTTVWDVRKQKHGDSSLQSSAQHTAVQYYKKRVLTHVMIYGSPEIVTTFEKCAIVKLCKWSCKFKFSTQVLDLVKRHVQCPSSAK